MYHHNSMVKKMIDSDDYHLERDVFELSLIHEAIQQQKPIFTVCRGTQLFNVAMGGNSLSRY